MTLPSIANGDSGSSARTKLNALLNGTSPYMVEQRMRSAARLSGSLPSVMASPPTFARSLVESLSTQWSPLANPDVDDSLTGYYEFVPSAVRRFSASFPQSHTLVGSSVNYGSTVGVSTACDDLSISFLTDAPIIEVIHQGAGANQYRVLVDGQLEASAGHAATAADGNFYVDKFTFASRTVRLITLRVASNFRFTRINTDALSRVWKPTRSPDRIRAVVVGDSYAEGTGANFADTSFSQQIAYFLGWELFNSGVGATGYLANSSGTKMTFRARFNADVTAYSPNVIVIAGGINDSGSSGSAIQTEASLLYAQALSENPNALVFVLGPFTAPASVTPSAVNTALRAAAQAQSEYGSRIFYIETMADSLGAWQFGTGRVGATTGDGNADVYIGSDGIHPPQAGHDYLTRRVVEAIKIILASLL